MPLVVVYGIPCDFTQIKTKLDNMAKDIVDRIVGVKELKLKKEHVSVFSPVEMRRIYGDHTVIVTIDLYELPERTSTVIHEMAQAVQMNLKANHFPQHKVEVFPRFINPSICSVSN